MTATTRGELGEPPGLVSWRDFALRHNVPNTSVEEAIEAGKLATVDGPFNIKYLDEQNQSRFYALFSWDRTYVRCEQCPHATLLENLLSEKGYQGGEVPGRWRIRQHPQRLDLWIVESYIWLGRGNRQGWRVQRVHPHVDQYRTFATPEKAVAFLVKMRQEQDALNAGQAAQAFDTGSTVHRGQTTLATQAPTRTRRRTQAATPAKPPQQEAGTFSLSDKYDRLNQPGDWCSFLGRLKGGNLIGYAILEAIENQPERGYTLRSGYEYDGQKPGDWTEEERQQGDALARCALEYMSREMRGTGWRIVGKLGELNVWQHQSQAHPIVPPTEAQPEPEDREVRPDVAPVSAESDTASHTKPVSVPPTTHKGYTRTITARIVTLTCSRCGQETTREQYPGPTPRYCQACAASVKREKGRARRMRSYYAHKPTPASQSEETS